MVTRYQSQWPRVRGNLFCVLIQDSGACSTLQCMLQETKLSVNAYFSICNLDFGMRHAQGPQ